MRSERAGGSRAGAHARFGLAPIIVCAILSACEFDKVGIPRTDALVAMHAVLSASAPSQVVLLERTRNGSVYPTAPPFDLVDPVVSDEGVAESGALVRLVTPAGDTLVAREDNAARDDRKGQGIYRFALAGPALERGATYRLLVQTAAGESLSAETSVPAGIADDVRDEQVFDRSRDTVTLEWPATSGARAYLVRIETPFGPRMFFSSGTRVRLTGELRNVNVHELPRVFLPGFPQAVTVSAVDSNFYDWYRTQSNTLTGRGLINRVEGGLGVFGALVRLHLRELRVTAPRTEPVAGTFRLVGNAQQLAAAPHLSFEIYVESPATRPDQANALSGRYAVRPRLGYSGCLFCGLLGSEKDGRVQLALLRDWTARDTVDVFEGALRGDTITGVYRGFGGPFTFVKEP